MLKMSMPSDSDRNPSSSSPSISYPGQFCSRNSRTSSRKSRAASKSSNGCACVGGSTMTLALKSMLSARAMGYVLGFAASSSDLSDRTSASRMGSTVIFLLTASEKTGTKPSSAFLSSESTLDTTTLSLVESPWSCCIFDNFEARSTLMMCCTMAVDLDTPQLNVRCIVPVPESWKISLRAVNRKSGTCPGGAALSLLPSDVRP
mmetsp:Transcript_6547/g.25312  ORF Transcript_6547/g.25312 Transcript_6547/m.25312 type:complete len:204 (+) Transcript_6547:2552-3163(+)